MQDVILDDVKNEIFTKKENCQSKKLIWLLILE